MATKNIVPRANGEGGIGTSVKKWLNGFFKNITVETSANVPTPGNSDNSTKAATTAFVENTFFDKLVAKLLATTAATITSLSTSSLFYRFLAQALSVAGVQYNLSNSSAWYICLGSLFGGLIIQGGYANSGTWTNNQCTIVLPLTYPMASMRLKMAMCAGGNANVSSVDKDITMTLEKAAGYPGAGAFWLACFKA